MPVVVHSKAQEAFHFVEVHTIATSSRLAGNPFRFSCSKALKKSEDMKRKEVEERYKEKREQQRKQERIEGIEKRGRGRKDENEKRVNEAAQDHQRLLIP